MFIILPNNRRRKNKFHISSSDQVIPLYSYLKDKFIYDIVILSRKSFYIELSTSIYIFKNIICV